MSSDLDLLLEQLSHDDSRVRMSAAPILVNLLGDENLDAPVREG